DDVNLSAPSPWKRLWIAANTLLRIVGLLAIPVIWFMLCATLVVTADRLHGRDQPSQHIALVDSCERIGPINILRGFGYSWECAVWVYRNGDRSRPDRKIVKDDLSPVDIGREFPVAETSRYHSWYRTIDKPWK